MKNSCSIKNENIFKVNGPFGTASQVRKSEVSVTESSVTVIPFGSFNVENVPKPCTIAAICSNNNFI